MLINGKPPHFVLLPLVAQGHMLPMVDIARLLASRGVLVTILLTPQNENRVKRVIDRAIESGLTIRVVHIKLPLVEAGLPEGWDNFDMLPSRDHWMKLFHAVSMLEKQVQELFQKLEPSPSCFIADMCYTWATNLALKLHIPRIMFLGTSCFSHLCIHMLITSNSFEAITSSTDYFVIPDFPDKIEITKAQMLGNTDEITPEWIKFQREFIEAEEQAFGTVFNTFEELEPEYVKKFLKVKGRKAWCVGPVSLCNKDDSDKAERGNTASIDQHEWLKWLDSHKSSSVIYVSLGSISRLSTSQLMELGLGLEASNRPFIWVIRDAASGKLKAWLEEDKFEERTKGRGLVIQGWAPQMLILSHPSVGAFLTHCGWNSTLEGVSAGLPLIAWPVFGDQFHNEKLIVDVIKTGVRAGVEMPVWVGEEESVGVQVKSEDIKMVIDKVMDGDGVGRERRERARKLGEMAKSAAEKGGSSYLNMTHLIQDIVILQQTKLADQSANFTELHVASSCEVVNDGQESAIVIDNT